MDGGAWWAAVHGVAKSQIRLSNFTFTFHFHALEKEMAAHSSVLAWRIPGTGEPGELPSMGLHRLGQDWSDLAAAWIYWKSCLLESLVSTVAFHILVNWMTGPNFFSLLPASLWRQSAFPCPWLKAQPRVLSWLMSISKHGTNRGQKCACVIGCDL